MSDLAPLALLAKDQDAASLLNILMRDLSELFWCAGWLVGLEFDLWSAVKSGKQNAFGLGYLHENDILELTRLASKAGGWWHWPDGSDREIFVPLDEWEQIYFRMRDPGRCE